MKEIFMILVSILTVFIIGMTTGIWIMKSKGYDQVIAFSMGHNREKNVWNKIRVDEEGRVICHKE